MGDEEIPKQGRWLSVAILVSCNEGLQSNGRSIHIRLVFSKLLCNGIDLAEDVINVLLSRGNASLVGEDDNAVVGFDQRQESRLDVFVRPDPIVGILGELGTTLDADECLIHIKGSNARSARGEKVFAANEDSLVLDPMRGGLGFGSDSGDL